MGSRGAIPNSKQKRLAEIDRKCSTVTPDLTKVVLDAAKSIYADDLKQTQADMNRLSACFSANARPTKKGDNCGAARKQIFGQLKASYPSFAMAKALKETGDLNSPYGGDTVPAPTAVWTKKSQGNPTVNEAAKSWYLASVADFITAKKMNLDCRGVSAFERSRTRPDFSKEVSTSLAMNPLLAAVKGQPGKTPGDSDIDSKLISAHFGKIGKYAEGQLQALPNANQDALVHIALRPGMPQRIVKKLGADADCTEAALKILKKKTKDAKWETAQLASGAACGVSSVVALMPTPAEGIAAASAVLSCSASGAISGVVAYNHFKSGILLREDLNHIPLNRRSPELLQAYENAIAEQNSQMIISGALAALSAGGALKEGLKVAAAVRGGKSVTRTASPSAQALEAESELAEVATAGSLGATMMTALRHPWFQPFAATSMKAAFPLAEPQIHEAIDSVTRTDLLRVSAPSVPTKTLKDVEATLQQCQKERIVTRQKPDVQVYDEYSIGATP